MIYTFYLNVARVRGFRSTEWLLLTFCLNILEANGTLSISAGSVVEILNPNLLQQEFDAHKRKLKNHYFLHYRVKSQAHFVSSEVELNLNERYYLLKKISVQNLTPDRV